MANTTEQGNNSYMYKVVQAYKKTTTPSCYDSVLQKLKKSPMDKNYFNQCITELMNCISLLNDVTPFIKDLIMSVPWHTAADKERDLFCHFVMSFVTAHSEFTYDILQALFFKLKLNKMSFSKEELASDYPEFVIDKRKAESHNICNLVCAVVKAIPQVGDKLNFLVRKSQPFPTAAPVCQLMFLYDMLIFSELFPSHQKLFLSEIFHQINAHDLAIDREKLEDEDDEIFEMDCDSTFASTYHSNKYMNSNMSVKSLDAMMLVMFRYIHSVMHGELDIDKLFAVAETYTVNSCTVGSICYTSKTKDFSQGCECQRVKQDEQRCKQLYMEMRDIFLQINLPTYLSSHIQYLIFYMLAIRPPLIYDFIDILSVNFESPNNSLELRRNSLSYIGSLLTRARFIPFKVMYSFLEILSKYCLAYIREGYDVNLDSIIHAPFYYAVQVLLHIFTFRYKEFTVDADSLAWARALQMDSIVNSHMNPLRYCLSSVAVNFAAVSCHFQLAYCYTVMEKNATSQFQPGDQEVVLLDFLPFEPYLLPRSLPYVENHYVQFCGLDEEIKMKPVENNRIRKWSDSSVYAFLSCSPDGMNASF